MSVQDSSPRSPAANAAAKPRRIWTPAEDAILKALVSHYGDTRGPHWKNVAAGLQDRSAKDCRKRWFHSLDPSLRKGRWTAQEDQVLLSAYARLGPAWHDIAILIPGRKDDQCSKRYNDILNPQARNRLSYWTPREDEILREGVQTLGHRWSAISAKLPGRPPLTCRNRWRALSRPSKESALTGTPSSTAGQMSGSETAISPDTGDVITPAAGLETEVAGDMELGGLTSTIMGANAGFGDDEMSFVTDAALANQGHIPDQTGVENMGISNDANQSLQQSFEAQSSDSSDCAPTSQRPRWGHVPESSHSASLLARHPSNRPSARSSRNPRPPQSAASSSMGTADYNIVAGSSSSRNDAGPDPTSSQFLELFGGDFAPDMPADLFRYSGANTSAPQQQVVHHHHHYHHHYHHHHHHHHHHQQQQQDTNALRQLEQQAEAMSMRGAPGPQRAPRGRSSGSFPS